MEVAVFVLCALHILSIQLQELPKILLHNGKAPVCGLPAEMEKKKNMKIQTEIAAVLLAVAVAALLLYRRHKRRQYPYRQKFLLTKTEYAFYKILEEKCTKNGLRICPKVRLEDFISVTGTKNIGKYRGYIKSRHVDFLICDKDLHIKAGLELDDSSHETRQAAQTDKFKNELFESIGLPLFRIKTIRSEYERQIDKMISQIRRMR